MDERTKQVLVGIIVAVIFIASVALIIIGQKNIGPQGDVYKRQDYDQAGGRAVLLQ